ncbi:SPA1-related 3 [Forsythia ovata]|uniref:SPA1-related 3 n=1 Tax=Forsythia ovata TaxID=205694 RepID=A0ABD1S6R4_9LAMI
MEGSSESGWQRSNSSMGLSSSSVFNRNSRILRASNIRSSGDNTTQESGFISGRKGRERSLWPHITRYRTQVRDSEDTASVGPIHQTVQSSDSLRQWLDNPERKVDALECLHIFSQIVDIVNLEHSQGIVVRNLRPSCFVISSFKHVSFIESASFLDAGSDFLKYGSNSHAADFKGPSFTFASSHRHQKAQRQAMHASDASNNDRTEDNKYCFPMRQILLMESNWYSSPEEVAGGTNSCASDIYQLGVLLFELFCTFSSLEEKSTTMESLRHRVLPPQLLLKWPKEASFCLWLLHPEPSSRPKMSELLQSDFLNEPRDSIEEQEAVMELREKIEEQELLLEFLLLTQQRKKDAADSLHGTISFISSDIEEVTKLQQALRAKGGSSLELGKNSTSGRDRIIVIDDEDSGSSVSRKRFRQGQGLYNNNPEESDDRADEHQMSEMPSGQQGSVISKNSWLMKNIRKLESAYLLTRRRADRPIARPLTRHSPIRNDVRGSMAVTERSSVSNLSTKEQYSDCRQGGWVNSFLEGLSKYLSFSKLKVKADLKQGDLLNSSNLVCSLSFDRDGEFFATAGVNKKIKVFEFNSILNEDCDIHYPVLEMASRSKLSNICWNGYIKSQIASSNFEGVVQVWDVTRSQIFVEMREHERRVWSVDFSLADPTMLASGSDDGSVKLWNINQGASVGTIRTKANVCCVQFPMDTSRFLAFGSADHRIYYYDLRNSKMPLCTLVGHNKTVSYVKFIDSSTLVSASTDNTLKLWDLSMCTSRVIDYPLQSFTGHLNVKHFVGLSVSEGYIATGSETNEVFVYHKAFAMPALSYKFSGTNSLCVDDMDGTAQFMSSVCWRGQSTTLVAANSMGNIKLLEMV